MPKTGKGKKKEIFVCRMDILFGDMFVESLKECFSHYYLSISSENGNTTATVYYVGNHSYEPEKVGEYRG